MKVCFTGGGTAGHIFPTLQVDDELLARSSSSAFAYERFWIGTKTDRDRGWLQEERMKTYFISSGKLRRYRSFKNLTDVFKIIVAIFQSLIILSKERPDVIFSKVGFVSVPPVVAGWILRIPMITHESDASAGLATRINARFVHYVCIPFEHAAPRLSPRYDAKLIVTGIPVRFSRERASASIGREILGIEDEEPLVVVMGGSLGASRINELVWNNLDKLTETAFVYHLTGTATDHHPSHKRYASKDFLDEKLQDVLQAATVVVSRAGATAIAELIELEKPMILIPLGTRASRGDQILNAQRLSAASAAVVLDESATDEQFVETVRHLLHNEDARNMLIRNTEQLHTRGARSLIADLIVDITSREGA